MSLKQRRRKLARSIEQLEDRKLLAADLFASDYIVWAPNKLTAEMWAEQITQNAGYSQTPDSSAAQVGGFASQDAATEAAHGFASKYWSDLFGQELDKKFWQEHGGGGLIDGWMMNDSAGIAATTRDGGHMLSLSNAQEQGVAEQDFVEVTADGVLFQVHHDQIVIFDISDPDEIKRVGAIETEGFVTGLYASGDRLIALSGDRVSIYDVSDASNPTPTAAIEIEGWIVDSRLTGGTLVVTANNRVHLPAPEFFKADGVGDEPIKLGEDSIGRFETESEYMERVGSILLGSFLPDVVEFDSEGKASEAVDLGDWEDLVRGRDALGVTQTSVLAIDIAGSEIELLDSETISGTYATTTYADADTLYFTAQNTNWWWNPTAATNVTEIYRVSLGDDGSLLEADSAGKVDGRITDSSNFSEHKGDLRVTTNVRDTEGNVAANLYVLRDDEGSLEVIGALKDIGDGQTLVATYFQGDSAVITTAEASDFLPLIDPLHTLDLSDPTAPVQQGEVEIPGVATNLQWISDTHLLGIGYIVKDDMAQRLVSLYDVTDRSDPKVVASYQDSVEVDAFSLARSLGRQEIHYDADSGLLIVPGASFWDSQAGLPVVEVDVDSDTPLKAAGVLDSLGWQQRAFVSGEHIINVGGGQVVATRISDLKQRPEVNPPKVDPPVIDPPIAESPEVQYGIAVTDESGAPVTEIVVGQKIWIELSADRLGDQDEGIYQAVFNVNFDREALEVVGDPEALSGYSNRFRAVESDTGFSSLGGFSSSTDAVGAGPQSIVRFQVMVKQAGDFLIEASSSTVQGEETLVYGENEAVPTSNVYGVAAVYIAEETPATAPIATDVNQDGHVSPQDALMVINYLNGSGQPQMAEGETLADSMRYLDVSGDGLVAPLDALIIINSLNSDSSQYADGEGVMGTNLEEPELVSCTFEHEADGALMAAQAADEAFAATSVADFQDWLRKQRR